MAILVSCRLKPHGINDHTPHIAFLTGFGDLFAVFQVPINLFANCQSRKETMPKVIRNKLGPKPDSHFENEPTFPAKNVTPLSKEMKELIEKFKDKYQPGDE